MTTMEAPPRNGKAAAYPAVYPMRTPQEKRDAYLARLSRLRTDRSSWLSHWRDLADHILPRGSPCCSGCRHTGSGRCGYGRW